MIFAIPRGKVTYVGTTDTNFTKNKNHVDIDLADALYLLSAVNHMFPSSELEMEDIESSWAGLRPLIHEEGKSTSELSRKDEIFTSDSGLISMAGGKLTGYRKMAERVVNRIARKLEEEQGIVLSECFTDKIPLCGNAFKKNKHVNKYISGIYERIKGDGFSEYDAWYLVTNYGNQAEMILDNYTRSDGTENSTRMALAELRFCIEHEMVLTPMDFFIRRTGRLYFDIHSIAALRDPVLEEFREIFGSTVDQLAAWRETLQTTITEHSSFNLERI
jgi:glycerol-3-phosphate dehydrogenase